MKKGDKIKVYSIQETLIIEEITDLYWICVTGKGVKYNIQKDKSLIKEFL